MKVILFYIKKLFTISKNEVLVLPSRVVVVLFFLFLLLLPVFTKDDYILRIFTLTGIFALLAASWDLLLGFTGGDLGISGISKLTQSRVADYYVVSVLLLGLCTIMWKITDSNIGIIFHALREDEA